MNGAVTVELPFKPKEMQKQASQICAQIHIMSILPSKKTRLQKCIQLLVIIAHSLYLEKMGKYRSLQLLIYETVSYYVVLPGLDLTI